MLGPECEFYLFETDERGGATRRPFDEAGYFDIAPLDRGENVRRQICLTLEEMGIQPERSHHEQGPGQNEIDFRCSSPLRTADDLMALRTAIKAIAAQNGLFASFYQSLCRGRAAAACTSTCRSSRMGKTCLKGLRRSQTLWRGLFWPASCGISPRSRCLRTHCRARTSAWASARPRRGELVLPESLVAGAGTRGMGGDCRMELRSPRPLVQPVLCYGTAAGRGV